MTETTTNNPAFELFCDEQGFDYGSTDPDAQAEVRAARLAWNAALASRAAIPDAAQAPVDYDRVVQICEAHGIGLPVDCVEMVVKIIRHAAPVAPTPETDKRDADTWRNLLALLIREIPQRHWRPESQNAPGHGHSRPGIWDGDNGALSGTQCAWCAVWNEARSALAATAQDEGEKNRADATGVVKGEADHG
ncbi:hypothetical protein [Paraburkholderia sp.]|uniref:hypothetical protein n=1 Tax=Paraburkholderia sp. TaxID=1926495 RepID=UPI00238AD717|nr:hypothetical protein [Paraburkholderia sp.]MDE1179444.1 hypothetical protein [Paraburkholderia sp.]